MSDFWDDFKDLFKTSSKKEEERRKKIDDALKAESTLADTLSALDKQYRESLPKPEDVDLDKLFPEDSGLKLIEYDPVTDEEIAKQAQSAAESGKTADRNKLERDYLAAIESLDSRRDKAEENLEESYRNLEAVYSQLREKTGNEALKRGLGRSSIVMGQLGNLDEAKLQAAGEAEAAYNEVLSSIDGEIGSLELKRDNALEELDLRYAAEIEDRIADLKKERDDAVARYEKYNNTVREKQAEYAVEREEDIAEFLKKRESDRLSQEAEQREYESKYGYSGAKQENYAKRYELAYDFYSSLDPEIAAAALEASPNMRYYLGNYYEKLLSSLKSGESSSKRYY